MRRFPTCKHIGYFVQYLLLRALLGLIRVLPVDTASALGGWVGRRLGPHLRRHAVARTNMRKALPELDDAGIDRALSAMWDNLGRTFFEYGHLETFRRAIASGDARIEINGREEFDRAVATGRGLIVFSGHLANWELTGMLAGDSDIESVLVYRAQNNPWVDRLLARTRPAVSDRLAPKGTAAARETVEVLRHGGALGVLVDQKFNEGMAVPFFGRDAMTVTGPAELAIRRGAAMIPVRIERLDGARFRIDVLAPLPLPPRDSGEAGLKTLLGAMNGVLESWIRARPGQWYWVHQRWPKGE